MSNETDRYRNTDPISTDEVRESVLGNDARKSKLTGRKAALGLAGGVLVGVTAIGVGMNALANSKEDDGASSDYTPPAEAPVTPGQTETEPAVMPSETPMPSPSNTTPLETAPVNPEEQEVVSYEIEAGLSDEELAMRIVKIMDAWFNAGATKKNADLQLTNDYINDTDAFARKIAEEESVKFEGIFPANFRESESLSGLFDAMVNENAVTVGKYLRTLPGYNPENIQPYRTGVDYVSIFDSAIGVDGSRRLVIDVVSTDNTDMNMYENAPNTHYNWREEYHIAEIDGKAIIQYYDGSSR